MTDLPPQLKCVLLTINEDKLVFPSESIVEIVPIRNIINVANKPNWMLGYLDWRGNSVPLISFELLNGVRMPSLASGSVRAAILYSLSDDEQFPYFAMLVQGAPEVVNIVPSDIVDDASSQSSNPAVDQTVLIKGEFASIVEMYKTEEIIKQVMTH